MPMHDSKFRVVIIGGGPTGLYLARALAEANIDYVVLERGPPTFLERGNHYLIFPHTTRLLHQIGLYEAAKERSYKLHAKTDMTTTGYVLSHYSLWHQLEEAHGYPTLPLQRCDLLDLLYRSIPNREESIRTGAKVTKIEETNDAVQVHLSDGTVERGSVVIGADGIHGFTRKYIHDVCEAEQLPDTAPASTFSTPTSAHFCSIFAEGPNTHKIPSGVFFETRDVGRGSQLGARGDMMTIILYKKLPQPVSTQVIYTAEQMQEMAESMSDMTIAPGVTVGDVWPDIHKHSARLVSQEEGFAKHWHTKRVVITGDAAVTTSSVNGLGVNCGLHSAALLASVLQQAVSSAADGSPSSETLQEGFARYHRLRARELKAIFNYGYSVLREITWDSWKAWFIDRFLKRWIGPEVLAKKYLLPMLAKGQILSYIAFESNPSTIPWRWNPEL